jgi:hypothetical protein
MPRRIGSLAPAALASLLLASAVPLLPGSTAGAAEECLAGPKAQAPQGRHWYYRVDRVKGRKCWYLGAAGIKTRQAAPQEAQAAPRVDKPVRPAAPLGRETAGDTLLPPAQAEQSTLPPAPAGQSETSPASTGGILMQSPASAVQWLDQPNPTAAMERDSPDAPVAEERVATEPQATDAADAALPPQPAAIETAESTGLTPQWMFLVIAAALAISGIVVPFKIAAARRRRIRIDGYRTAPPPPPASNRIPPRFDSPIAPPRRPDETHDDEALRQILRSRDRRAA